MFKRTFSFLFVFVLTALLLNSTSNAAELQARPDLKKIDGYIERMMKECRIPGFSLTIVKGGGAVYTQGYGIADPMGRKVTPQTPFQVANRICLQYLRQYRDHIVQGGLQRQDRERYNQHPLWLGS